MALSIREEIVKSLRASPLILNGLVRGLDTTSARWKPSPDEWAIIEVVAHMADTDERALQRSDRILREPNPWLPEFDQERLAKDRHYLELDLHEQVRRYAVGRRQHVAWLESLPLSAWKRTGMHSGHGEITLELYEAHVACEDIDHLAQVAAILDQAHVRR